MPSKADTAVARTIGIDTGKEAVAELRSDVADGALCACCFPGWRDRGGVIPLCLMAA